MTIYSEALPSAQLLLSSQPTALKLNRWAAQKIREKKGAPKVDYVNQNVSKQQLVLTGVWAVGIIGLFVRIAQVQLAH